VISAHRETATTFFIRHSDMLCASPDNIGSPSGLDAYWQCALDALIDEGERAVGATMIPEKPEDEHLFKLSQLLDDAEDAVGRVEDVKAQIEAASTHLLDYIPHNIFAHIIWRAAAVADARCSDIREWRMSQLPTETALARHLSLRLVCREWEICVNQCLHEHLEELKAIPRARATLSGLRMLCVLSRITLTDLENKSVKARIKSIEEVVLPKCSAGHYTYIAEYSSAGYEGGWECNTCGCVGRRERWFCRQCSEDYCFKCHPNTRPVIYKYPSLS